MLKILATLKYLNLLKKTYIMDKIKNNKLIVKLIIKIKYKINK
jgi:hypothetical protein